MPPLSIITVLTSEHQEVSRLLKQALDTTERATEKRSELWTKINDALTVHTAFEEGHLYPLLMTDDADEEAHAGALEAVEEHAQIKRLLRDVTETPVTDERWKAKVTVLAEDVRHHVKEEEQEGGLFADLKRTVDAEILSELAQTYQARRGTLQAGRSGRSG
jgi:hypothetical protein